MNRISILALCIFSTFLGIPVSADESKPNFVFFLVDDLGWSDLGCFGSTFYETPNIDKLCASGMKFTNGYAACPVCSPTRASIMTGRHPVRVDITDWIPGARRSQTQGAIFRHIDDRDNLALSEVTIAEALRAANYQTFFAGKWHLGDKGHWPKDQGFDFNIGGNAKGSPPGGYYAPWKNPTLESSGENEYLTERLTKESINFLKSRNESQPFLLYLSYYNVHTPITPYKKRIDQFRKKALHSFQSRAPAIEEHEGLSRSRQDNSEYASMVAAVDDSVGAILSAINERKLANNTVIIFFSDNGGLCTLKRVGPTCNLPLRSGKGWLYEGGVREPMIMRVPGITRPGSVCDTPVVSMDFFPTILELAGLAPDTNVALDGVSILPLLTEKNTPSLDDREFYWHYPHYHGSTWTPGASIRIGSWKLIEFYHWKKTELYDLSTDPGERHNLVSSRPDKQRELLTKLHEWQSRMNARMPVSF